MFNHTNRELPDVGAGSVKASKTIALRNIFAARLLFHSSTVQVETVNLLQSLIPSEKFTLGETVQALKSKFTRGMEDDGLHFKCELIK